MVVWVLLEAGAQLASRGHRLLRLLGELERRASRRDLGVAGALLWNAIENLLRLGELSARGRRPSEARERFDIGGLALQDLRIERAGAGMIVCLQRFLGHGQRLF